MENFYTCIHEVIVDITKTNKDLSKSLSKYLAKQVIHIHFILRFKGLGHQNAFRSTQIW